MAHALDLDLIAEKLLQCGLASFRDRVVLDEGLARLADKADRMSLVAIARILLKNERPFWLNVAVNKGGISREYIPKEDLEDLLWIEPELDQFLIDIHALTPSQEQDALRKRIGDVAELFVFEGLKLAGANPVHVAKISDSYGYDIECRGEGVERIEVKAASGNTQGSFHLSRNEFDKSTFYAAEWRLVQVVFSNSAFVADRLNASHIDGIRELRFGSLHELVLPDTVAFRWTESALITAPQEAWESSGITLDPTFVINGFFNVGLRT